MKRIIEANVINKGNMKIGNRSLRGRTISISDKFEEEFALFLEEILPTKYSFLIDFPLSYHVNGRTRKKTTYPDIAIVENASVLAGVLELKIDLGFLRKGWAKDWNRNLAELSAAKEVSYRTSPRTGKKGKVRMSVLPDLPRAIVLLTANNDHKRLGLLTQKCKCHILSMHIHPRSRSITELNLKSKLQKICSDSDNCAHWQDLATYLGTHYPD